MQFEITFYEEFAKDKTYEFDFKELESIYDEYCKDIKFLCRVRKGEILDHVNVCNYINKHEDEIEKSKNALISLFKEANENMKNPYIEV